MRKVLNCSGVGGFRFAGSQENSCIVTREQPEGTDVDDCRWVYVRSGGSLCKLSSGYFYFLSEIGSQLRVIMRV